MSAAPVGGHYALTSHHGDKVTPASFADRHQLFFFGFTHCKVVCPETLTRLSLAIKRSGVPASLVQPLYVTVDPERDTPQVMKAFLEQRFPLFLGLTGSRQEIDEVKARYLVFAERRDDPSGDGYEVPHSAYAFLMMPAGDCAAYYTSADTIDEIAASLRQRVLGE